MKTKIRYSECVHGDRAGNFDHYVTSKATKQTFNTLKDTDDRITEVTTYYHGSRIIGKQTRDICGYRYFLRD